MNTNFFKKAKIKNLTVTTVLLLTISLTPGLSNAQVVEPWTGSIAGSNLNFSEGEIMKDISNRLNKGEIDGAVRLSKRYIDRLESGRNDGQTNSLIYDAYNALCVSLTAASDFDGAMDACDFAIKHSPKRWHSFNSRGSLNYKTGNYAEALNDYRNAFSLAPKREQFTKIIEHNIKIAESKLASN
jgi:tetratricopeptide (TPR) repeat protein